MSGNACFTHLVHTDGSSRLDFTPQRVPCGASDNAQDVFNCCSPGDTCLEGNLCHFEHAQAGSTGYYLAGCTDPEFKDPKCMQHCFDEFLPDVTYNYTTSRWACCTSGTDIQLHCDKPSDDTWLAPPPEQLKEIATVPASATISGYRPSVTPDAAASSSTISRPASTTGAAALSNSNSSADSSLSPGAKGGIIAVVVIVVLAALGALAWFLLRRRRRRRGGNGNVVLVPPLEQPLPPKDFYQPHGAPMHANLASSHAEHAKKHAAEFPSNQTMHEMPEHTIVEMPHGAMPAELAATPLVHPSPHRGAYQ